VIEEMRQIGKWKIYLWRADTWEKVTDGVSLDKIKKVKAGCEEGFGRGW
jgi:hypothetical protein